MNINQGFNSERVRKIRPSLRVLFCYEQNRWADRTDLTSTWKGAGERILLSKHYCTNKNIDTDGQPISFLLLTIYVLIRGRFKWNTELQLTLL